MGLLTWVLIGLVAAEVEAELVPGGGRTGFGLRGLVLAICLGVGGAVLGGFISSAVGWGDPAGFNVRSLPLATLGTVLAVGIGHSISSIWPKRRADSRGIRPV